MLSRISKNAAKQSFVKSLSSASSRRTFVQPSGADRASVVDVPATYQDDNHFTPRPGDFSKKWEANHGLTVIRYARFQVGSTSSGRLIGGKQGQSIWICRFVLSHATWGSEMLNGNYRQQLQWTLGCWMLCFHSSLINMAILTAERMHTDGRQNKRSKSPER